MDANANEKILAKDVMKTEIISVSPETTVKEVARLMIENKISARKQRSRKLHVL